MHFEDAAAKMPDVCLTPEGDIKINIKLISGWKRINIICQTTGYVVKIPDDEMILELIVQPVGEKFDHSLSKDLDLSRLDRELNLLKKYRDVDLIDTKSIDFDSNPPSPISLEIRKIGLFDTDSQRMLQVHSNKLVELIASEQFALAEFIFNKLPTPKQIPLEGVMRYMAAFAFYSGILPCNISSDYFSEIRKTPGWNPMKGLNLEEIYKSETCSPQQKEKIRKKIEARTKRHDFLSSRFERYGTVKKYIDSMEREIRESGGLQELTNRLINTENERRSVNRRLTRSGKKSRSSSPVLHQCWLCYRFYEEIIRANGEMSRYCDKPDCKKTNDTWQTAVRRDWKKNGVE
jgi:hypothetical protein